MKLTKEQKIALRRTDRADIRSRYAIVDDIFAYLEEELQRCEREGDDDKAREVEDLMGIRYGEIVDREYYKDCIRYGHLDEAITLMVKDLMVEIDREEED